MSTNKRRARRVFTDEFKAEAVGLMHNSGKSIGRLAKGLDLTETALRDWVAKAAAGSAQSTLPLNAGERAELKHIREDNRVLRMECDVLKRRRPCLPRRADEIRSHQGREGQLPD